MGDYKEDEADQEQDSFKLVIEPNQLMHLDLVWTLVLESLN
jgi:hypothetical protein